MAARAVQSHHFLKKKCFGNKRSNQRIMGTFGVGGTFLQVHPGNSLLLVLAVWEGFPADPAVPTGVPEDDWPHAGTDDGGAAREGPAG